MVRVPPANEETTAIAVRVNDDQPQAEQEDRLWKGRRVKKGCYAAAGVEALISLVTLIPGGIMSNTSLTITGSVFGLVAFTTFIATLNCCTPETTEDYPVD